jgi:hypothetical protein
MSRKTHILALIQVDSNFHSVSPLSDPGAPKQVLIAHEFIWFLHVAYSYSVTTLWKREI